MLKDENLQAQAVAWIELDKKLKQLESWKRETGERLMGMMREHGLMQVYTPVGVVGWITSAQVRPAKKDIIAYFGPDRGDAFWQQCPKKVSEYLSLIG